jgi:hypothetical protein
MSLIGAHLLREDTAELFPAIPSEVQENFIALVESSFWEQTETAYIRMASNWDRVGQILDFAFFSIRQFERDGLTAVMDRICSNFVPMDSTFSGKPEWKRFEHSRHLKKKMA